MSYFLLLFYFIDNDDIESPPESLIARGLLTDLCGEAAKLKSLNALSQVLLFVVHVDLDIVSFKLCEF